LLKRVFDIDIEQCPHCGGTLKIIAAIEHPTVIADPRSSRLVRPGTAPISGTGIRSIPSGLIPTNTRFNPVQLPEPTLSFGLHLSETPNCLDIWHPGPMNGPKSPRSWTQGAGD